MAEEITSLQITRRNAAYWTLLGSDSPNERDADNYTGTRNGDYLTIKTLTGAVIYKDVYYAYISYIDVAEPENNMTDPPSARELQAHLIAQGFYVGVDGGGGGTGVSTFKALLDVNVPSFTGRALQLLRVNAAEQFVESFQYNPKFTDSAEWIGGQLLPNQYILTSNEVNEDGSAKYIIQAPISQVVNRAFLFDEVAVVRKGYTNVDTGGGVIEAIPNTEPYLPEYGDYCEFTWRDPENGAVWLYTYARWATGDFIADPANYIWDERNRKPLPTEPI